MNPRIFTNNIYKNSFTLLRIQLHFERQNRDNLSVIKEIHLALFSQAQENTKKKKKKKIALINQRHST